MVEWQQGDVILIPDCQNMIASFSVKIFVEYACFSYIKHIWNELCSQNHTPMFFNTLV